MSQHTELITVLLKIPVDGDDWKTIKEAADALQAMERVPMTDIQAVDIFVKAVGHDKLSYMIASVRLVEAHHGITPPESNDVLHTE